MVKNFIYNVKAGFAHEKIVKMGKKIWDNKKFI